jgi:hypothetical protein
MSRWYYRSLSDFRSTPDTQSFANCRPDSAIGVRWRKISLFSACYKASLFKSWRYSYILNNASINIEYKGLLANTSNIQYRQAVCIPLYRVVFLTLSFSTSILWRKNWCVTHHTIAVSLIGVTINRSSVRYADTQGIYSEFHRRKIQNIWTGGEPGNRYIYTFTQ